MNESRFAEIRVSAQSEPLPLDDARRVAWVLVRRYLTAAYAGAAPPGTDMGDVEGYVEWGLHDAGRKYRPGQGMGWVTYAANNALFQVRRLARDRAVCPRGHRWGRAFEVVALDDTLTEWSRIPDDGPAVGESLERQEHARWQLNQLLAGLPDVDRAALLLHYGHELTWPEVASRLGLRTHKGLWDRQKLLMRRLRERAARFEETARI